MIKAAIIGAAGLSGQELLRILKHHGGAQATVVTSSKYEGRAVQEVFPELGGIALQFTSNQAGVETVGREGCDVAFLAVPNKASLELAPILVKQGVRVVDLSGVYRLSDTGSFTRHYGLTHTSADLLGEAVFGLPEGNRAGLAGARLVANPGCYPTGALLGLLPLGEWAGLLAAPPVIDAKSGVSGAGGRVEDDATNYMEVHENFKAYKVFNHQHTPEIAEYLETWTPYREAAQGPVIFTPHLLPVSRGILSTIYLRFAEAPPAGELRRKFAQFCQDEPFLTLLPEGQGAELKMVTRTNNCVISLHGDDSGKNWVVITAIDNLVKGASGQAVQNMNLMFGLEEGAGLL